MVSCRGTMVMRSFPWKRESCNRRRRPYANPSWQHLLRGEICNDEQQLLFSPRFLNNRHCGFLLYLYCAALDWIVSHLLTGAMTTSLTRWLKPPKHESKSTQSQTSPTSHSGEKHSLTPRLHLRRRNVSVDLDRHDSRFCNRTIGHSLPISLLQSNVTNGIRNSWNWSKTMWRLMVSRRS